MKQILFIINPASARGTTLRKWTSLAKQLPDLEIREHVTAHAGEATEVTRKALVAGVNRVIAVGGDGTLNEVANGYFDEAGRAINDAASIGLLPSGTGSDFQRSLRRCKRSDLIETLLNGESSLIDAAHAEFRNVHGEPASRFFINIASFGLGGDVSALVNRWKNSIPRWIGGRTRFSAAAIAALKQYRNVPILMKLDDDRSIDINSNLVIVANGRFGGGGMMLAPRAELDDGLLDVIVTDRATRWDVIKELPRIQRGAHLRNPKVSAHRVRAISIRSEVAMAIDLDGEMVGYTDARIRVLPSAIRFVN
ncbi:MAG TPA: diacylglycerol kinase family protein [Blastocatellia bacterium]|nr:diacylglycerol kinase family protein [Blastocatellia bacterium]